MDYIEIGNTLISAISKPRYIKPNISKNDNVKIETPVESEKD